MRKIDDFVGIPLCILMHYVACLKRLLKKTNSNPIIDNSPKRILIMKFLGMGSIILSFPSIKGLKETYPSAEIVFLTFSQNREIVELLHLADHILTIRTISFFAFCWDLVKVLWHLRREKPEISIDMEFFSRLSMLLNYLSGSPVRVGFYLREFWRSGPLLTHKVYFNPFRHITEVFSVLFNQIGPVGNRNNTRNISLSSKTKAKVERYLENGGWRAPHKLVVINPNSGELSFLRKWPGSKFVELALKITQETEAFVVFIGSLEERKYVGNLIEKIGGTNTIFDLSGKITIEELAALFKMSSLLISNDTGPLHLAISVGTPTISLFGPESPWTYGPLTAGHAVLYRGLYCSPCLNVYNIKQSSCLENVCLTEIQVEEVMGIAKNMLNGRAPELNSAEWPRNPCTLSRKRVEEQYQDL